MRSDESHESWQLDTREWHPKRAFPPAGAAGRAQLGHMLLGSRQRTCGATFVKTSQRRWGQLASSRHASAEVAVGCRASGAAGPGCQCEGSQRPLRQHTLRCGRRAGGTRGQEMPRVQPSRSEGVVVNKDAGKGKLTGELTPQTSAHMLQAGCFSRGGVISK